jgi:hypothetical protein
VYVYRKIKQRRKLVGFVWKFPSLGKHGAGGEKAVRVALKEKLASASLYKQRWAPRQDHLEAKLLYIVKVVNSWTPTLEKFGKITLYSHSLVC